MRTRIDPKANPELVEFLGPYDDSFAQRLVWTGIKYDRTSAIDVLPRIRASQSKPGLTYLLVGPGKEAIAVHVYKKMRGGSRMASAVEIPMTLLLKDIYLMRTTNLLGPVVLEGAAPEWQGHPDDAFIAECTADLADPTAVMTVPPRDDDEPLIGDGDIIKALEDKVLWLIDGLAKAKKSVANCEAELARAQIELERVRRERS